MGKSPFEQHGLDHLSPSSLNLYQDEPAFWALKYLHGFKDDVGPRAWRGSAVEAGLDHWLFKRNEDAAKKAALDRFELEALGELEGPVGKERDRILPMLKQAMQAMGDTKEPTLRQHRVEFWFDGIEVPIIGNIDYEWEESGLDLKTTYRMPSEIPSGHARQVALYSAARRKPYRLLYVTESKSDFKEMTPDEAARHLKKLEWHAHAVRRVLSMFSCPKELARIFVPDFDNYRWSDEAKVAAMEIWQ